ncbi:unnamed protein product [Amoebophrya sp. A120]|nr:unnamed protein product [Amoebophrya sp. A120]|eukprot:GSA120T00018019001.1
MVSDTSVVPGAVPQVVKMVDGSSCSNLSAPAASASTAASSGSNFVLSQNDEELQLDFMCAPDVSTRDVHCNIRKDSLKVVIGKELLFEDELIGKIDVDESAWQLEKLKKVDKKQLSVTLVKTTAGKKWKCVGKREAAALRSSLQQELSSAPHGVEASSGGPPSTGKNAGTFQLKSVISGEFNPDDDAENAAKNENDEVILEREFLDLRKAKGLNAPETLDKFFELFDNSIQLYRLNMLAKYLEEIVPVCRAHPQSKYKLKGIQAYAFVLWKKNQFREALPLFLEMEDMLGPNGALCENIAHTYNSLGNYEKAEEYFSAALKFCQNDESATSQKGGVLLGLGLVRDRQQKTEQAETIVRQAYEFYRRRSGGQLNSLQAKAGVALAKILAQLGRDREAEAEQLLKEASHCYEVTCGAFSPLTCSGYQELGRLQWRMSASTSSFPDTEGEDGISVEDVTTAAPTGASTTSSSSTTATPTSSTKAARTSSTTSTKRLEARKHLKKAYQIAVRKDCVDILQLMECHNFLMETITHHVDTINRVEFREFTPVVTEGVERLKKDPAVKQDGNAGVFYKLAGEFLCWCGEADSYTQGKKLLGEALELFRTEKSCDCKKLMRECKDMIEYAERVLSGEQQNVTEIPVNEADQKRIRAELDAEQRQRQRDSEQSSGPASSSATVAT